MKVISATRTALVLKPSKGEENHRAFVFDIDIVPDKPKPKKVIIRKQRGPYVLSWSMSWRKFGRQTCIGHIAIIEKKDFTYTTKRA